MTGPAGKAAPPRLRQRSIEYLAQGGWADLVFVVCLLEGLVRYLPFPLFQPSTTRQLMLTYILIALSLTGSPWRRLSRAEGLLVLLCALMPLVGLLTWTEGLGSQVASPYWTGWHGWVLLSGFLSFAVAYGRARWTHWRRILITVALVAAGGQALWLGGWLLRGSAVEASRYGDFYGLRPLSASVALLMAFGFVLLALIPSPRPREVGAALFLGVSVVLSQHRSVWAALIGVLILLALRGLQHRGAARSWISIAGTGGFLVAGLVLPAVSKFSLLPVQQVAESDASLPDVATSTHSMEWRLEMWRTRLEAPRSLLNTVFGGIFGITPVKIPGDGVMNAGLSAHNMAVDVYTMLGLAGLLVIGALVGLSLLARADRLDEFAIMLWALIVFSFFYNWPEWTWLIVGVAFVTRKAGSPSPGRADEQAIEQTPRRPDSPHDRATVRAPVPDGLLSAEPTSSP